MAIVMLTRFKGDQDFTQSTRERAALLKKHGAVAVRVGRIAVGPHAGQILSAITYADWASYGRAMQAGFADADLQRNIADFMKNFEMVERSLIVAEEY